MPPARLTSFVTILGSAYLAAIAVLLVTQAPLGSPTFFAVLAVSGVVYAVVLIRVWNEPDVRGRALTIALWFAVLFRVGPALAPVGPDSDMVRYLWDGRVQRLGYNPYDVIPADPALAHTHTPETAAMPSRRHRTPYPPGAQLFFRLIATVGDSTLAMKLALVACDLITIVLVRRWLVISGRGEWLVLAYAWHPLVVLEVAHSGHVDALGAMWLAASAYWLTARRTALAAAAFVLAVGTKLLPIVLAPLFIGRLRTRDVVFGGSVALLLYAPFIDIERPPVGALPNVVANIRFNGPLFQAVAYASAPHWAAAAAVLLGLGVAACARWRLPANEPAAWVWPMAVALASAPVIYPWYLLYATPFLFTAATLPITAWTGSVTLTYLVWDIARHGGRWLVPPWVLIVEFALPLSITAWLVARRGWLIFTRRPSDIRRKRSPDRQVTP
jgi:hypothetical protein